MTDHTAAQRPADPADLAPSAGRRWADEFIIEQRLLDVPGDRIGDALITIEDHLRESGESADEAFGDPKDYARELAEASGSAHTAPSVGLLTGLGTVLGLAGLLVTGHGFSGILEGGSTAVTVGNLVGLGVMVAVGIAMLAASTGLLRLILDRIVIAGLLMAVVLAVVVGATIAFPQTAFTVSPVWILVLGLVLVAASTVMAWIDHEDDVVTAPGEHRQSDRQGRLLAAIAMPVATVLVIAFAWLVHVLA